MIGEALGINELWLFVLSGLLLDVAPGPDTAYIIGRSIQFGWRGAGGRDRDQLRLSGSRVRHRDRPVGAADDVLGRIRGRQAGRSGLSVLLWRPDAAVAAAPGG